MRRDECEGHVKEEREQNMCGGHGDGEWRDSGSKAWEVYMATTWAFGP